MPNTDHSLDSFTQGFSKASMVAEATVGGMLTHGVTEAVNNPLRFGTEVVGATALSLAMKGPSWVKLPALGFAALGTYSFAAHSVEAVSKAAAITANMTDSNLVQSKNELSEILGPLAFDTVVMVGAGHAGMRLAGALPKTISTTDALKGLPTLSLDHGPQFALEGVAVSPSAPGSLAAGSDRGKPLSNLMAMITGEGRGENLGSSHSSGKGNSPSDNLGADRAAHGGSNYLQRDGYVINNFLGTRGENVKLVETMPAIKPIELVHGDQSVSKIAANGRIVIEFPTGEARMLDLGKPIKRVTVSEYADGQKQYRLNETVLVNMEVNNLNHEVKVQLANGDKLHMVDNIPDGYMSFNHQDGLKTWIEYSGRMVFELPNGQRSEATIPSQLASIRLLEKTGGGKQFQFLDPEGRLLPQKVDLPPAAAQARSLDDLPQWRALTNYLTGRTNQTVQSAGSSFEMHRIEPSPGGYLRPQQRESHVSEIWNSRFRPIPLSRAYGEQMGIDRRVMPGNDLSTVRDVGLAMQKHNRVVMRYLNGLNR